MGLDGVVVASYLAVLLLAGVAGLRRLGSATQEEFLTGARRLNWKQAALAVIAMTADPGVMGFSGLAFLWGLVIHWNAVNMWFSAPFAAFFLLPVYWRTGIVTAPEFLERRFSTGSRVLLAALLLAFNVVVLAAMLHLGGLILSELFHWPILAGTLAVLLIAALYMISGGMRALLAVNRYQSVLVLGTIFGVAAAALHRVGGPAGLAAIRTLGSSGRPLPSTLPPWDWSPFSQQWFPFPAILLWAPLMSIAWLACNQSFVQCFLATRSLADAQKALLAVGAWSSVMCTLAYIAGVAMRRLAPDILPDRAFLEVIAAFPPWLRGVLIAGLIASLLSAVNGLLMSSSALATRDIYCRLGIAPRRWSLRAVTRVFQVLVVAAVAALLPAAGRSRSITAFIQYFMADVFGVIVAWFLVGIFSRRAAPRSALTGAVSGILGAVCLDVFTGLNFAYVGFASFVITSAVTLILSRWEKPAVFADQALLAGSGQLESNGPDRPWAGVWRWAAGSFAAYMIATLLWEWYLRR